MAHDDVEGITLTIQKRIDAEKKKPQENRQPIRLGNLTSFFDRPYLLLEILKETAEGVSFVCSGEALGQLFQLYKLNFLPMRTVSAKQRIAELSDTITQIRLKLRETYAWRKNPDNATAVARELDARNIPSPSGKKWNPQTVRNYMRVIDNENPLPPHIPTGKIEAGGLKLDI